MRRFWITGLRNAYNPQDSERSTAAGAGSGALLTSVRAAPACPSRPLRSSAGHDPEGRAFAGRAADADGAAQQGGEFFGDRQAQARAAVLRG